MDENEALTVPTRGVQIKSSESIYKMSSDQLATYVTDLEGSLAMNRNMLHEFLIERISAGEIENGEKLEELVYQNRILESEIDEMAQQAKNWTAKALMNEQLLVAAQHSKYEVLEHFEDKQETIEYFYYKTQDHLLKEKMRHDDLQDECEMLRAAKEVVPLSVSKDNLLLHNKYETRKLRMERMAKEIFRLNQHIEKINPSVDSSNSNETHNASDQMIDSFDVPPLPEKVFMNKQSQAPKLPMLNLGRIAQPKRVQAELRLNQQKQNDPNTKRKQDLEGAINSLKDSKRNLQDRVDHLTHQIVVKSESIQNRFQENQQLLEALIQTKQKVRKKAKKHHEFMYSEDADTSFNKIVSQE